MAERSSADVQVVFWNGWDIRPFLTQMNVSIEYRSAEAHVLGDDYVYFGPLGIYHSQLSMQGFFDDGATAVAEAFEDTGRVEVRGLIGPSGNEFNRLAIGLGGAAQSNYNIETPKGDFVKASAQASAGGITDPVMTFLAPVETITADDTGATLDETDDTTAGGVLYLGVAELDLDGGTDLTLELEDSPDGDGVVFTGVTGGDYTFTANGTYRLEVPGSIGRYVRVVATWTGGGAGRTAKIVAAWHRNPEPAP